MKPRQNLYRVLTQEDIIGDEQGITNIFKQLKKKYKVDAMVQEIQTGVNKDNAKHIEQLEKQKAEIARLRNLANQKMRSICLKLDRNIGHLSSSSESSMDDSVSNSSDESIKPGGKLKKSKTSVK